MEPTTKYDQALATIARCKKLRKAFEDQVTTRVRDKTGLSWRGQRHQTDRGGSITLLTEMYTGYYGSSSCTDRSSVAAAELIARVLDGMKPQIIERAIKLCEEDAQAAAQAAAEEARSILDEMEDVGE